VDKAIPVVATRTSVPPLRAMLAEGGNGKRVSNWRARVIHTRDVAAAVGESSKNGSMCSRHRGGGLRPG